MNCPTRGTVFVSVHDLDKERMLPVARKFSDMGFGLIATKGTAQLSAESRGAGTSTCTSSVKGGPTCWITSRTARFSW